MHNLLPLPHLSSAHIPHSHTRTLPPLKIPHAYLTPTHAHRRFGRLRALFFYSVLRTAGGVACVLAPSYGVFAAARVLTGAGIMGTALSGFVLREWSSSYTGPFLNSNHTEKLYFQEKYKFWYFNTTEPP